MDYDLVIVGGGLGGSALGIALAQYGARVLIVEKDNVFRDRVRGEGMLPWGAAEARALGIYDPLVNSCGHEVPWWTTPQGRRDLPATSPSRLGALNFYHPDMQQRLIDLAVEAGADVRRPAEVMGVLPGPEPAIIVRAGGSDERITARLVVGADGRNSRVRTWAGFSASRDPDCLVVAGALFHGVDVPEDSVRVSRTRDIPEAMLIFPIGAQRFRTYFVFRHGTRPALSGSRSTSEFVASCVRNGAPSDWFRNAALDGPIASFDGAESWVEQPYRDGVALIGDAAATSDPSFGTGLSLTLRDVRVLRDHLVAETDWNAAAAAYAAEHNRYYGALHRIEGWWRDFFYGIGPEAEAVRSRAMPMIANDPSRVADIVGMGPEAPHDETARRRFFGED